MHFRVTLFLPHQRYRRRGMASLRQGVQTRNSVGWATEELLILAEQIVSFLPANIQTKYFMIKAELLRRAAVVGATYHPKNTSESQKKEIQEKIQMKIVPPVYVSHTPQYKQDDDLEQHPPQNESNQLIENNALESIQNVVNNTKMTVEELRSETQQNKNQQHKSSDKHKEVTKNIQKQKKDEQDHKNHSENDVISLTNTAEHIQVSVITQDAEVQTDIVHKKTKDNTKQYEDKIQQLNNQIKSLQDQLEVEKMKNSELVNVISHRTQEVAQAENKANGFKKNQLLVQEVIAGLISKIGGGDGFGSGVLKQKGLSELLDLLNSQINVFCGYVFETQEKLRAQLTEHNNTVSALENKLRDLQQAVEVAEEAQTTIKQDAARCIREIAQRADQHVSTIQTRLADLFRDFQKAKYAHGFRESVSKMFEVSSENNSRDQSVISRSIHSSQSGK